MNRKTVGLVSAISALPRAPAATAAEARTLEDVMSPRSYAELLKPIPNAAALLAEAKSREEAREQPRFETAQYYGDPYYGGYGYYPYRPRWHHHHHHHWNGGWGYGRPRYYRHHHHHHHWNGGGWW